jgi:hypothetical protein
MDPKQLTYVKYGLCALVIVGGFALVLAGKLDAADMFGKIAALIAALVVALGISSGAQSVRAAMDRQSEVKLAIAKAPDASHRPNMQGFARLNVIAALTVPAVIALAGCALFGNTKFPQDVLSIYECVQTQVEAGQTNVGTIAAACLIQEEQLVADAIAALLASKTWVRDHPAQVPAAAMMLRDTRAKLLLEPKMGRNRPSEDGGAK